MATGALTVLVTVAFVAVGALAPAVLFGAVGALITWFVAPGRRVVTALAGLFGALVAVLGVNLALGGDFESWADGVFAYGGGVLGAVVVVLSVLVLIARPRSA